jgi:argininosuccinate lyase
MAKAYKKVGLDIENGTFTTDAKVNHRHEGSIGNLCTGTIKNMMDKVLADFNFEKVNKAVEALQA